MDVVAVAARLAQFNTQHVKRLILFLGINGDSLAMLDAMLDAMLRC